MTIEELFRDDKNKRNGWSLRDTKITRPDRLDRLLLILAIAYLLLCGIGLIARSTHQALGLVLQQHATTSAASSRSA